MPTKNKKITNWLLLGQGVYFLLTGIWPFIHLPSFLYVTGPKTDIWLLKTVAALIVVMGLTFLVAGIRRESNLAIITLAVGSAVALMGVDIYYATIEVIWKVYLLDAALEALLIVAWLIVLIRR